MRLNILNKNYLFLFFNFILFIVLFLFNINVYLVLFYLVIINASFYVLYILFKKYKRNKQKQKLELALLDEVLVLSSQPRTNDLKQLLYKLSNSNHKIVSKEFKIILKKIEDGHNVKSVFQIFSKKYNSEIIDQFLDLLYTSVTTGTVTVNDYRSFANNFLRSKQLLDERNSALLIQKYTIIFAGGFIVPGILGVVISLVKKLTGTIDLTLISQSQLISNSSLFTVCYYCSIIYIIEYVIISSIYLSMLESDLRKTIVYLIFLMPVASLLFFIGSVVI